ncbi:MAG: NAD-dependent epimerase/dehydratase family protein, partial [DPANN group archaeon]|nr:NAD-dependent epimerase/dehydratase family protein [DPANN group archaeon]
NDIENIIFTSSAAVYGEQQTIPIKENAQLHPSSTYAISKIAAERAIESYREKYGLNITTFRIFNVYGPGQDPNSPYAAAVPKFINRALKGQDLIIYGDGKQTRDFIYIGDVVDAIRLALRKRPNQTLNLASGKKISIISLADKIRTLTGSSSKIEFEGKRAGDLKDSYADITKLKDFGFVPEFDLEDGLKETIKYFRN